MDLALYLHRLGLTAPTAALLATIGVCCALVLLGVALVAWREGWGPHSQRRRPPRPRGATRHKPGQP
jgi:hypothetical protein